MSQLQDQIAELTEEQQRELLARLAFRRSRPSRTRFPLSSPQKRLWILEQIGADTSAYNVPAALRLEGTLNGKALAAAFGEVIRRHQSLRTVFGLDAGTGEPWQAILPYESFDFERADLTSVPSHERTTTARNLANLESQRRFDLTVGPLIRVRLLRLDRREHILLLTMHHIVSDGWSAGVLIQEVIGLYEALTEGLPSPLPELSIQYVDFAAWQNKRLESGYLDKQSDFWRNRLQGPLPVLELPTRGPRPDVMTTRGAELGFQIDAELTGRLNSLSRGEGATLFMTLLAAFLVLIYRYTGREDIIV
ncbi:MAG: condensation domain-containing protein, partial [Blastocatellia bacterium]